MLSRVFGQAVAGVVPAACCSASRLYAGAPVSCQWMGASNPSAPGTAAAIHSSALSPLYAQVQAGPQAVPSWVLHTMAPQIKALLIDAAGTLLVPTERTADVYLRYARKYGVKLTEQEVLQRFRSAYNTPWADSRQRYVGDGRPFWRFIVAESTGCSDERMFEEVYDYYARPEAWRLAPGTSEALNRLRAAGVRLAVVSNFDTRLRPILRELGVGHLFDAVVVSAEVGVEKPNPVIYEAALKELALKPGEVIHVGDDRRNDVWGARDAGITAWLWGVDVKNFKDVANKLLLGRRGDEEDE